MTPFISVIVPVYNVEKYLHKCINSLLHQDYTNFEIILINDGSTDSSFEICMQYENISTVTIYSKENSGLSDTRNFGALKAKGDFVIFVDSDDYVKPSFLSDLAQHVEDDTDIVTSKVEEVINGRIAEKKEPPRYDTVDGRTAFSRALCGDGIEYYGVAKLIKTSLFLQYQFVTGKTYEDAFTIPRMLYAANKVCITNHYNYLYVRRENSITIGTYKDSDLDCIEAHKLNLDFTKAVLPQKIDAAQFRVFWAELYVMDKLINTNDKNKILTLRREILQNKKKALKNKYLSKYRKISLIILSLNTKLYKTYVNLVNKLKSSRLRHE